MWNIRRNWVRITDKSCCKLDLVALQWSDGTGVVLNEQAIIHFTMGRGMRIMNLEQDFLQCESGPLCCEGIWG
jgi:hypothetical protein